jgi:hypothetical protein
MKLTTVLAPAAIVAALTLTAAPAQAQRRDHGNPGGSAGQASRGQAVQRAPSNDRGRAEAPRQAPAQTYRQSPPVQANRQSPNVGGRAQAWQAPAQTYRQSPSVQAYRQSPNAGGRAQAWQAPAQANRQYRDAPRAFENRNAPRAVPRAWGNQPRGGVVPPYRSYGYRSDDHRSYGYQPYVYAFRPRLRVGLGIYLGYPVPYPVYDPYAYSAPVYGYPGPEPGYPPPGTVTAAPGSTAYGAVSLEISPANATVDVDGNYAGVVADFSDPSRPLSLVAGRHHVELQAPGYAPMGFDVDVVAGQVIPYRGELQP